MLIALADLLGDDTATTKQEQRTELKPSSTTVLLHVANRVKIDTGPETLKLQVWR